MLAFSLIRSYVKLTKDDLLYLHRKAVDVGFWDMPELLSGQGAPDYNRRLVRNTPYAEWFAGLDAVEKPSGE